MSVEAGRSVIHVLWSGRVGGIERLVIDLSTAQLAAGYDVQLAFGVADGRFVNLAVERGLSVHDLGFGSGFDVRPRVVRRAMRTLQGCDVVHLHGFNIPFALAASRSGRCIVYTEHGFTAPAPTDIVARVKRREKRRFLNGGVDAIAANSQFTAQRLAVAGSLPLASIHVVHNGIDTHGFGHPVARCYREGLRIVTVSRLVGWKRVHLMLEALARTGDARIDALVVGDGPERASLEVLGARLGLAERVRFIGFSEDVGALLSSADVLVHPSADEWFGLAVVEGIARGLLPIVFSDGGGVLEVLPEDGKVVDDVEGLAEVLGTLVGSSSVLDDARATRSEWACRTFSIERTTERYGDLYAMAGSTVAASRGQARRRSRRSGE